jgi:hypothetical protein
MRTGSRVTARPAATGDHALAGLGSVLERLRELADVARRDPQGVDKGALLGASLDLAADALERHRGYTRKDGSFLEGPDPDHGSAVRALALATQIRCGIKPEDAPMTLEEFKAQLQTIGLKLVPDDGIENHVLGPALAAQQGAVGVAGVSPASPKAETRP